MCLGGGGNDYVYEEPKREKWVSEYESAPDTVNNKLVSEGGDYSQDATKGEQPKRAKLKGSSSKKQSDKY